MLRVCTFVLLAPKKGSIVVTKQKIPTNSYEWDVASQFSVFCLPQISDITFQWQKTCPKVLPGKLTHRFLENTHLSWQITSKMVDAPSRFFWVYRWLTIKKLLFQSLISKKSCPYLHSKHHMASHPRCGVEQMHFAMLLLYGFRY